MLTDDEPWLRLAATYHLSGVPELNLHHTFPGFTHSWPVITSSLGSCNNAQWLPSLSNPLQHNYYTHTLCSNRTLHLKYSSYPYSDSLLLLSFQKIWDMPNKTAWSCKKIIAKQSRINNITESHVIWLVHKNKDYLNIKWPSSLKCYHDQYIKHLVRTRTGIKSLAYVSSCSYHCSDQGNISI